MLGRLEVAGSRRRVGARVGNAGKRRRDRGEEHKCEDNGTLHLFSLLSSLTFLRVATRGAFHTMCDEEILISPRAATPGLRALAGSPATHVKGTTQTRHPIVRISGVLR